MLWLRLGLSIGSRTRGLHSASGFVNTGLMYRLSKVAHHSAIWPCLSDVLSGGGGVSSLGPSLIDANLHQGGAQGLSRRAQGRQ